MYGGSTAEIGPSCLLSVEGIAGDVRVVVSSDRTQCLDRALFTHFGVDPSGLILSASKALCISGRILNREAPLF